MGHVPDAADHHERLHKFAHDIRNRLAGIQEVLRSVPLTTDPAESRMLAEFGEKQFFKAMGEVETLLDDMGVVRGVPALSLGPVDLAAVARTAVTAMAHRTDRKQQQVLLDLAEGTVVHGDERLLGELATALLSNASKFSPAGAPIHITVDGHAGQGRLIVRDHGVGLSPADLERVFVRYAWLGSRTTDGEAQGRSTLARLKQWAIAHGGDLRADSPGEGQGCTLTLCVPLLQA
jgi:two-component system CheB/CheR fusion protein